MALEALLLTSDPLVVKTLRRALDTVNVDLQVSSNAEETLHLLNRHKYDALLVDCDDVQHGPLVLGEMRKGKSNKSCIAFAIVNGGTSVQQAFEMGANFVLDKPIAADRASRGIRAAHGLIMRERRRYHRHLVNASGTLLVDGVNEIPVSIITISEGGVSIECDRQLHQGGAARLRIMLPGSKRPLDIKGEIM